VEGFILSAVSGFNLTSSKIYRDKFGHVCDTDKGPVRIQRPYDRAGQSVGSPDVVINNIMFQHEIKEYLHTNGILVDRFLMSAQDAPYYRNGDDIYAASYAVNIPNADFAGGTIFLDIIAHVAKMHHVLSMGKFSAEPPKRKVKFGEDGAKQMDGLQAHRKRMLKTGKFSEFDMLFLKGYDAFAPYMQTFANMPKSFTEEGLTDRMYICHNLLKEENIYCENDNIIITNWGEAGYSHCLFDLVYILKRYIKSTPETLLPIDKILETYCKHNPSSELDAEENKQIFRHILLYPDKFIKVAADYYSKKRSFAPKTYISRMEECFNMGDALLKYVN